MRGRGPQTWEELLGKIRIEKTRAIGLPEDCWNWYGRTNDGGYGVAYVAGYSRLMHRFVWERLIGTIPDKMELDHLCRNPRCVNPAHLEPVTGEVNNHRKAFPLYEIKSDEELSRECADVLAAILDRGAS